MPKSHLWEAARQAASPAAIPSDAAWLRLLLSSAAWARQWAYSGGGAPRPDVAAIVGGLVALVERVSDQEGEKNDEPAAEEPEPVPVEEAPAEAEIEPAPEPEEPEAPTDSDPATEEPVPDDAELPEDQPSEEEPPPPPPPRDPNTGPRPHPIR